MTEQQLVSYERFIDVVKLTTFDDKGDWNEELFEDIYSDFCKEVYNKDWVDISDGELTRMSCLTKDEIKSYELSPGLFGVFG